MVNFRDKKEEIRMPFSMNTAKKKKKKIEEKSRMRKARDLFNKIGDIKRTFHARVGLTKYRNSKD